MTKIRKSYEVLSDAMRQCYIPTDELQGVSRKYPLVNEFFGKKKDTTLYIGIDPDRDKNGVALYSSANRRLVDLLNLRFFELLDFLKAKKSEEEKIMVVIEAGWENEGNWHTVASDSARKSAKIGKWVGGNHEVGRKIVEMVEYLDIPYMTIIPKRHKVDAKEFRWYTHWDKRTNQEQRDAAMLVIGF